MVARCFATRQWWKIAATECELVTSRNVLQELSRGKPDQALRRLSLLDGLLVLEPDDPETETAAAYVRHKLMPADPLGDAMHLAMASHHRCDLLVT